MASIFSIRGIVSRVLSRSPLSVAIVKPPALSPASAFAAPSSSPQCLSQASHPFSTSSRLQAKEKSTKGKRRGQPQRDPKIVNMLRQMALLSPDKIPPPLRMARNRHLRHWTIHRAWLLFRRRERRRREGELLRQYQGMYAACEELRLTDGPGTREQGYLYRVALEKKGVYGYEGVPIEYARPQTESPAREAWNHDWKRS